MSIISTNGKGAILKDDATAKFVSISDLSGVIQFERDSSFMGFQAFHYEVKPVPECDSNLTLNF